VPQNHAAHHRRFLDRRLPPRLRRRRQSHPSAMPRLPSARRDPR